VYLPCVLQTKKRYVGNKFEHPDELVGIYEAKGIETVRRDGVPAQAKELQECIQSVRAGFVHLPHLPRC
jgi:DNA polymerase zeta